MSVIGEQSAAKRPGRRARHSVIERHLVQMLHAGQWNRGQQLPSEQALSRQYGVCRSTMKKALSSLAEKGLIVSHQGKGHFAFCKPGSVRTWTLGVSLEASSHFDHPVTIQKMAGIQEELLGTPYQLKILVDYDERRQASPWTPARTLGEVSRLDLSGLDAIITKASLFREDGLRQLAMKMPVCCIDWYEDGHRLSRVSHDFTGGIAQAAGHLISLGHSRFAVLNVVASPLPSNMHEGVRLAAMAHGGQDIQHMVVPIDDYTEEQGRLVAARLFGMPAQSRPTAIISSDEVIEGVQEVARHRGVQCPGEVSLVRLGDGSRLSRLTAGSIQVDYREEGRRCARELLRLLDDPDASGQDILLPVAWVAGDTIGPAPG